MGSGFWTGLLDTVGTGIAQRREQQHAEDIDRDKLRLARLQNEISSPYFNPEHLPEVLAEMDDINANLGKPKPRGSAGGKKPGIFSQILGGLQEAAAVPQGPQPAAPEPAGRFLTPQQLQQQELDTLQKKQDIQNKAAIELERVRQQRKQKIGSGITGVTLPLGTTTLDGTEIDPHGVYDLFQSGNEMIAVPAKGTSIKTNKVYEAAPDGTFTQKVYDAETGALLNEHKNILPPAQLLPYITTQAHVITDADGNVSVVPVTTKSGRELPPIPEQGGAPPAKTAPTSGITVGTPQATGIVSGTASRASDARSDKSYQYTKNKIDTLAKPIVDLSMRFSRLVDSLDAKTPLADSLIAPELLTAMAGGMGSGMRLNEAEMARIVNGRSNLEAIKAALNKWTLDPTKALSVTPATREQMYNLVRAVNSKLLQKQTVIDAANRALIDSDDPKEHRKILADMNRQLLDIDKGASSPSGDGGSDMKTKSDEELWKIIQNPGQ